MRRQLHIGKVARLLGVTTKTIRHYQKIGLLREAERSHAGYRLFDAHDVLRIQQIRRLQAYGLSLRQITEVLGAPQHEHSLHEVLQLLDQDLERQIHELEERRAKIHSLLVEEQNSAPEVSPTLEMVKELLGEHLASVSSQAWEQEVRMDALLDSFHWPMQHREAIQVLSQSLTQHPELLAALLELSEGLAALADVPEDSPAVEELLEACARKETQLRELLVYMSSSMKVMTSMEEPYMSVFAEMIGSIFSPAQQRFFTELRLRYFMREESTIATSEVCDDE